MGVGRWIQQWLRFRWGQPTVRGVTTSRGSRRRAVQFDPPQPKDDQLREVINSRMTARPNWQKQGGFASLMQEIAPGMNAADAPSVDELLLVSEGSVEFLFGTSGRQCFASIDHRVQGVDQLSEG